MSYVLVTKTGWVMSLCCSSFINCVHTTKTEPVEGPEELSNEKLSKTLVHCNTVDL